MIDLLDISGNICKIFLPWIAFLCRLQKRSHPFARIGLCIGLYSACEILLWTFSPSIPIYAAIFFLFFVFLFLCFFSFFCIHNSFWDALYCSIWSYVIYHFNLQLVGIIRTFLLPYASFDFWLLTRILRFPVSLVSFCLVFFLIAPKIQENGTFSIKPKQVLLAFVIVLPVIFFNNHIYEWDGTGGIVIFLLQIFSLLCCVCALFMQKTISQTQQLEQELHLIRQLWYKEQQQYEMSQKNIALINQKCHDLRHQIFALQYLVPQRLREEFIEETHHSIRIYDSIVKTGNAALDTVLTEKSLFCENKQIKLLCVADGKQLNFMNVVDIYTIFGNALENAIECVEQNLEPSLRSIQVKVYADKKLLRIGIENYCCKDLKFKDNIPLSTKERNGFHGFGLKSIQYIAKKYHGCMTIDKKDKIFSLKILLPIDDATPSSQKPETL